MKTPKPTIKDLENKICRLDETIRNMETANSKLRAEVAGKVARIVNLHNVQKELYDQVDAKKTELAKRVHGLTALAFAVLAFAVGIVVGGNIRSQSQDNASIDSQMEFVVTNNTTMEIYDSQIIYPTVGLDFKPGRITNTVEHVPICPAAVQKPHLSPYVKKGAELLRQPRD